MNCFFSSKTHISTSFVQDTYRLLFTKMNIFWDVNVGRNILMNSQLKDTHREKGLSNKTPALRKSTNMGVWAAGTLNQLFIRGS